MRKANEIVNSSGIYARLHDVRMSGVDRQHAINALQQAEQLVEAMVWVSEKFSALGHYFLKPSLKN